MKTIDHRIKPRPPVRHVAWHEGGHATVALHHPDLGSKTLEVCVVPTDVVGYVKLDAESPQQLSDEQFLRAYICVCLGGFVSDKLSGEVTEEDQYGSDMSKVYETATQIAELRKVSKPWNIGPIVAQIISEEFMRAQQIINDHRQELNDLVHALVTKGKVTFNIKQRRI